ncbi:hypothetical protein PDE_08387 [Penicillium oxalicum 114-2]|uniref:Uncharacterized protein n=1 Tax=Penicillium oxalicum (strain 114-2 / CGMCC 5302) TaxID=933388 RepID=S7ZRR9_PENO1|nr:hypothetical protein PDE_08387 [Penicillium oxalicum 114-2]
MRHQAFPPPASSLLPGLERSSITLDFGAPRLGLQCCQEIPSILKAYPIIFGRVCVTRKDPSAHRDPATDLKGGPGSLWIFRGEYQSFEASYSGDDFSGFKIFMEDLHYRFLDVSLMHAPIGTLGDRTKPSRTSKMRRKQKTSGVPAREMPGDFVHLPSVATLALSPILSSHRMAPLVESTAEGGEGNAQAQRMKQKNSILLLTRFSLTPLLAGQCLAASIPEQRSDLLAMQTIRGLWLSIEDATVMLQALVGGEADFVGTRI